MCGNPAPFESVDAVDLAQRTYGKQRWFVRDLLGPGCYLLASKPKLGKSHLCLQLGVSVATGTKFLDTFDTEIAGVCLLELEDGLRRAQKRLWALTDDAPPGMRIAEDASRIDTGLLDQIALDKIGHPDTGMYVVDTFAAVRPPDAEYAYQTDYALTKSIADFATEHGVCIILVHHCRKSTAFGDSFDNISGTNGLTAGATGMVVLEKDRRDAGKTIMTATGKDIEGGSWRLEFARGSWRMVEPMSAHEVAGYNVPGCVLATIEWMDHGPRIWSGTTTELLNEVAPPGVSASSFGKFLAQYRSFMREAGIEYTNEHRRNGNVATLTRLERVDDAR